MSLLNEQIYLTKNELETNTQKITFTIRRSANLTLYTFTSRWWCRSVIGTQAIKAQLFNEYVLVTSLVIEYRCCLFQGRHLSVLIHLSIS